MDYISDDEFCEHCGLAGSLERVDFHHADPGDHIALAKWRCACGNWWNSELTEAVEA